MITKHQIFPENQVPAAVKVGQVAELLSVRNQTVYKLIESGQLTAADIAITTAKRRHLRITRDSLLTYYKKSFGHSLERALAHAHES